MRKRIAVVGGNEEWMDSLRQAAQDTDALLAPVRPGETLPSGTAAVLAATGQAEGALDAALEASREHEGLLGLIADAVACREGIALGSSERVREHAARFAKALELSPEDTLTLERAALLRDIGKIKIDNDVLIKKSVLSYDEWALLKAHSRLGAELLEQRGVCRDILEIVWHHHESYDGDGYPDHLERDAIPYLARAMKILDVYCAMTSPRHYRRSVSSREEAIEYLRSERGKHFDPGLIDAFLDANLG